MESGLTWLHQKICRVWLAVHGAGSAAGGPDPCNLLLLHLLLRAVGTGSIGRAGMAARESQLGPLPVNRPFLAFTQGASRLWCMDACSAGGLDENTEVRPHPLPGHCFFSGAGQVRPLPVCGRPPCPPLPFFPGTGAGSGSGSDFGDGRELC